MYLYKYVVFKTNTGSTKCVSNQITVLRSSEAIGIVSQLISPFQNKKYHIK